MKSATAGGMGGIYHGGMNIAVLGGSGRSGRAVIEAALRGGHRVTAGVRSGSMTRVDPRVRVVKCDATNPDDLRNLAIGQDALVSVIGHVKGSPPNLQTRAMEELVGILYEKEVRRIVSLTGTGVRLPGDRITIVDRILNMLVRVIAKARITDGIGHARVLQNSTLDWTIIRVLQLTNGGVRPYRLTEHGPTKLYVARREVAQAILEVLEQESFVRKAPIISPPKEQ